MPDSASLLLLLVLACASGWFVHLTGRCAKVIAASPTSPRAGAMVRIWLPLSLALPCVATVGHVDVTVAPAATGFLTLPVALALMGAGVAALRVTQTTEGARNSALVNWHLMLPLVCGVIVLLQGLAGALTVGIGQACLATAAVLLWVSVPGSAATRDAGQENVDQPEMAVRASSGLLICMMLAAALIESAAIAMIDQRWLHVSLAMVVVTHAAAIIMFAGRLHQPHRHLGEVLSVTVGLGVLMGVGCLSLQRFMQATAAWRWGNDGGERLLQLHIGVAWGFNTYWLEGVLMVLLPMVWLWLPRERVVRIVSGWLLLGAGVMLIGWRLWWMALPR
ncbi:MAG: hypothetical protein ACR2GY_00035 [Phycisphaerales bacterium]